eukprot:CFRG0750T1
MRKLKIFSGTANTELTASICKWLGTPLSQAKINKTLNGESDVEILDSVRDMDVYIVQSGCGDVNDALMELCIMVMACKMSAARRVVAVVPYYFYSKQSKKKEGRRGIPAKLAADMLKVAGATHVVCLDLHASQIQGFFDLPCDNLNVEPFFLKYVNENILEYEKDYVILAKNAGAAKRAGSIAGSLKVGLAMINSEFQNNRVKQDLEHSIDNSLQDDTKEDYGLLGNVSGMNVIIMDDMIDTPLSFIHAAKIVKKMGGKKVLVIATHGIFSGDSLDHLQASCIDKVIVTNSVPQTERAKRYSKLCVVDISPLLTEAIRRIHYGESLSFLGKNVPL